MQLSVDLPHLVGFFPRPIEQNHPRFARCREAYLCALLRVFIRIKHIVVHIRLCQQLV
ncbi:Uncharacterised protein [Vibrio cholerae]|nr:Uncharacterised protein [Vibrio cholerae]